MTPLVFWLALACGVDAGYEPGPDGHLEYIIQIEPQLVEPLAAGRDMTSEVPRGLDIRHYRVTVGTAVLPKNAAATGLETGGGSGGVADQSEALGRSEEVIGSTTPQFRASYQALATGGGRVAIEIDPAALADLYQHDLTGDIRPGLTVTRFVVSTNPGTVPDEVRSGWTGDVAPTRAAMPPIIETGTTALDDDPSSWKAEPLSGPTGPSATPVATAGGPGSAAGASPGGTGPGGTGPAATAGVPTLATPIPDDDPGGSERPPSAMPPPSGLGAEPPSTSPLVGEPSNAPSNIEPPGNSFRHRGGTSGEGTRSGYGSGATGAPAPLPSGASGAPLNSPGSNGAFASEHQFGAKPPHDPTLATTTERQDDPAARSTDSNHKAAEPQPIPYLPLTVVTCGLLFSLGVNVYLGWHVWESYHPGRVAVHTPPAEKHHEKKHERKTSLAH